ncbi:MAG: DNA polymerase Y family protein [Vitreoscilla sp.]|nr:DNA polymerase Y family protein [Vitreoscilla sp.]
MLWLGLHLPALSLESFVTTLSPEAAAQPVALLERQRIVAVNTAAQSLGVRPGMKRATAMALAPALLQGMADAQRDAQALCAVAHVLLAFTPTVVLVPPQGVLAEVQASLRCFGGAAALWRRVQEALVPLGHQVQMAHAPGPLGAELLACWRPNLSVPRHQTRSPLAPPPAASEATGGPGGVWSRDAAWAELQQALAALPAECLLAGDANTQMALQAMGLATLADLRRQPRAGLARRFGQPLLLALDRAHGLVADPREPISPPLLFDERVDLHARTEHTDALLAGAAVLLARMAAWARARHARVQRFVLTLHHETRLRASSLGEAGAHASTLAVALAEPTADATHWQAVLRERLQREPLAASVLSLSLHCHEPVLGPPPDAELFPGAAGAREGLLRLLERLQARLGPEGVQRLATCADHRPERATMLEPVQGRAVVPTTPEPTPRLTRPVWLLAPPQPLHERQARPWLDGHPLQLLGGPERIETGWWEGEPVARDYFIAQTQAGELLWLYRLRPAPVAGEPGWFLHGRFA